MAELLIVIAILGILAALGAPSFIRWQESLRVSNAAQQFAQDVLKTRTASKRYNGIRTISVPTSSSTYTYSGAKNGSSDITVTLQNMTITPLTSGVTAVNFSPPYGTTSNTTAVFQLTSTRNTTVQRTVRVVSMFGEVVVQ